MAARRPKFYIARDPGARGNGQVAEGDIFDTYSPPFDLISDMLFVGCMASTRPLRREFPGTPFLNLGGFTPLVVWFSRVRSLCYGSAEEQECLDESTGFGYNELNVVALLRGRRIFVPGIYATGELSRRLGLRYGMPKSRVEMDFSADSGTVLSSLEMPEARSEVRAGILSSGRLFALPFGRATPWWTWPASFPDGSFVRANILRVPRLKLAHVEGQLELPVSWLTGPRRLLPVGVYVPGLRMLLPGPGREARLWSRG